MKTKKSKKRTALLLLLCMLTLTFVTTLAVGAVECSYTNYYVNGTDGQNTPAIVDNAGYHPNVWVWAAPPSGRQRIVHRTTLRNSDENAKSGQILTYEDTRNQGPTSAQNYYYYHMYVQRHFDYDDEYMYLSGKWGWIY